MTELRQVEVGRRDPLHLEGFEVLAVAAVVEPGSVTHEIDFVADRPSTLARENREFV